MGTIADVPNSERGAAPGTTTRPRAWARSAGVVAAVALLVVGPSRTADATEASSATADAPRSSTSSPPSRFATLSTGSYAWHVVRSSAQRDPQQETSVGPLHGEFPVVAVDGTVQTRRWQWGRVDTVGDGKFSVMSDDGYRDEYVPASDVDPSGITVGQQVTVVAVAAPAPE